MDETVNIVGAETKKLAKWRINRFIPGIIHFITYFLYYYYCMIIHSMFLSRDYYQKIMQLYEVLENNVSLPALT